MSALSRRNFIAAGGAAAAGAAVLVGPMSHASAAGSTAAGAPEQVDDLIPEGEEQLVVYVRNASTGEVSVMTDGHEVVFTDKVLVARVQKAAKRAVKVGAK